MIGDSRCPCCGYRIAVPSTPYSDSSVALIDSLTREVAYLRLVVSRFWSADPATGTEPSPRTDRAPMSERARESSSHRPSVQAAG